MPFNGDVCTRCGAYQDWRKSLHFPGAALALLVSVCTVLGAIYGASVFLRKHYFESDTAIAFVGANQEKIYLQATNSGPKQSALLAYRMTFSGALIEDISLRPGDEDIREAKNIIAGDSANNIGLTVSGLRPLCKPDGSRRYNNAEIKELLNGNTVTLKVTVRESDRDVKDLSETLSTGLIRDFIMQRVPVHVPDDCS